MLVIRQEQLDAFSRYMEDQFAERAVAHLKSRFPAACAKMGEPGLRQLVRDGSMRAESYAIESERDTVRFLELLFIIGPEFDLPGKASATASWARPMLEDRDPRPDEKLRKVYWTAKRKGQTAANVG
jgi:hypothetical protein